MTEAHVYRQVNYVYFLIVLGITLTVLGIAIYTKNKRAVKMFLFAMVIWAFIEGFGLVTGMRVYSDATLLVFIFVALVEDPGWVCLGYMMAEQLFKRLKIINKQSTID
ncbi:MAG: hypothetical protein KAJ44_05905 [Thermoplasmatales archaeon]|nr:hypothetical protein [Thermoplasmatales archaeon]